MTVIEHCMIVLTGGAVLAVVTICLECLARMRAYRLFRNTISEELCEDMVSALIKIGRIEQENLAVFCEQQRLLKEMRNAGRPFPATDELTSERRGR